MRTVLGWTLQVVGVWLMLTLLAVVLNMAGGRTGPLDVLISGVMAAVGLFVWRAGKALKERTP